MLESISGSFRSASELETDTNHFLVAARVEFGTGNRHVPFFRSCPRGVRNWKQACPIFSELPAWSSAWSSPVPQVRVPGRFAETLDSGPQDNWKKIRRGCRLRRQPQHFFGWEEFTSARARQGSNAGQARPGFYARHGRHQAEPSQSPGPLLYVLHVLYLRVLAICAICAISYTPSRRTSTLPRVLAICAICAISYTPSRSTPTLPQLLAICTICAIYSVRAKICSICAI